MKKVLQRAHGQAPDCEIVACGVAHLIKPPDGRE
jgi:hypothetical protein